MSELRVIWAIVRKDLTEWLHQPRNIIVTFLPSVLFMLILLFQVSAVGRNKVALVVQGSGPHTQQLLDVLQNSAAFLITPANADEAANKLSNLQVEAVITIPGEFDAAYDAHQPDPVTIQINNLNLDFTNDLRRSLPAAITTFYSQQNDNPIHVKIEETDLRAQDIDLLQFQIVPLMVQLLTVAGIINTGLATAHEWEDQTIKELYLAPIKRRSLIIGKIVAGWIITLFFGALVIGVGAITGFLRPVGVYWLVTAAAMALIGLTSAGIGVALAAFLRKELRVMALGINVTFYLFFLSGGISVAAFLPAWVRSIAQFIPTFYGVHALQMAVFYSSTDQLARDMIVLIGTALIAVIIGAAAMRRQMLA